AGGHTGRIASVVWAVPAGPATGSTSFTAIGPQHGKAPRPEQPGRPFAAPPHLASGPTSAAGPEPRWPSRAPRLPRPFDPAGRAPSHRSRLVGGAGKPASGHARLLPGQQRTGRAAVDLPHAACTG